MLYLEKDSYVSFLRGFLPVFLSDLVNPHASIKAGFALDNGGKAGERNSSHKIKSSLIFPLAWSRNQLATVEAGQIVWFKVGRAILISYNKKHIM